MEIKTMSQWNGSGKNFTEFAVPGDAVDEEIAEHFLNCVPPASMQTGYFQCGEPYSHRPDERTESWRPTFFTFTQHGNHYRYCGTCFLNQTVHRG